MPRASTTRRLGRWIPAIVILVVWGLITHGTHAGSGDEPHYLIIAHSIAFDGDLDVRNNYQDARLIAAGGLEPELHVRERSGALYPVHDVGWPLAMAPILRVAYPLAEYLGDVIPAKTLASARLNEPLLLRHQMSLVMALLTGLLAREVFLMMLGLGIAPRSAFAWSLLFALSPPILAHSFLVFTEVPTALIAAAVARRLLAGVTKPAALVVLGLAAGFLLLIHIRNIGLAAGLIAMALIAAQPGRRKLLVAFFGAGVAIMALARTVVTFGLWSTFVTTPHAATGSVTVGTGVVETAVRMVGLLVDREYGLLAYAPIYLLAAAGWMLFARSARRTQWLGLLAVSLAYLIPVLLPWANMHGWTGGWSPAARFLVPIAAFLWIPIAVFWARSARVGKGLAIALVLMQLAMNAYVWQQPKTLWNEGDGKASVPWASWLPSLAPAHAGDGVTR